MPEAFKFIPVLWAGAILKALQKKSVFESLCNKDYIGNIKQGNTLKIATVNNPTVKDYEGSVTYEDITGTETELDIDQEKYFAFKVGDIEAVQSSVSLLESATEGAGYALADDVDAFLAALIKTEGTISGTITADSAFKSVARVAKLMDDAKAPDAGRWLVTPTDFAETLTLEIAGKMTDNKDIITSGYIGSVLGLNIFKSTEIEKPLCGHVSAVTFGNQIEKTESLRLQNSFATGVRGLHVYGGKVTRPTICGELTINIE